MTLEEDFLTFLIFLKAKEARVGEASGDISGIGCVLEVLEVETDDCCLPISKDYSEGGWVQFGKSV